MTEHVVEVAVKYKFKVSDHGDPKLLPYLINGNIREVVEQTLPAGWVLSVGSPISIDGKKVPHVYE